MVNSRIELRFLSFMQQSICKLFTAGKGNQQKTNHGRTNNESLINSLIDTLIKTLKHLLSNVNVALKVYHQMYNQMLHYIYTKTSQTKLTGQTTNQKFYRINWLKYLGFCLSLQTKIMWQIAIENYPPNVSFLVIY